jgi:hypothetical protein
VYNAVRLIGPDGGTLAGYRKTHLYGDYERAAFTPGDRLVVHYAGHAIDLAAGPWPRVRFADMIAEKTGETMHPAMPIDELIGWLAAHTSNGSGPVWGPAGSSPSTSALSRPPSPRWC